MDERKKYFITCRSEVYFVELTKEQANLMAWLADNGMLDDDMECELLADIEADRP